MAKTGSAALLLWCQKCTDGYPNVKIENFHISWRSGLGFCAIIHHFYPDALDFKSLSPANILRNNELAFETASKLGIPKLLDAEDMLMDKPEGDAKGRAGGVAAIKEPSGAGPPAGNRPGPALPSQNKSRGTISAPNCAKCSQPLRGNVVEWNKVIFHQRCFTCTTCRSIFNGQVTNLHNKPYCKPCGQKQIIYTAGAEGPSGCVPNTSGGTGVMRGVKPNEADSRAAPQASESSNGAPIGSGPPLTPSALLRQRQPGGDDESRAPTQPKVPEKKSSFEPLPMPQPVTPSSQPLTGSHINLQSPAQEKFLTHQKAPYSSPYSKKSSLASSAPIQTAATKTCPFCNKQTKIGNKFCENCGKPQGMTTTTSTTPTTNTTTTLAAPPSAPTRKTLVSPPKATTTTATTSTTSSANNAAKVVAAPAKATSAATKMTSSYSKSPPSLSSGLTKGRTFSDAPQAARSAPTLKTTTTAVLTCTTVEETTPALSSPKLPTNTTATSTAYGRLRTTTSPAVASRITTTSPATTTRTTPPTTAGSTTTQVKTKPATPNVVFHNQPPAETTTPPTTRAASTIMQAKDTTTQLSTRNVVFQNQFTPTTTTTNTKSLIATTMSASAPTTLEGPKKPDNRCPKCRRIVSETSKFCIGCGTSLKPNAPVTAKPEAAPSSVKAATSASPPTATPASKSATSNVFWYNQPSATPIAKATTVPVKQQPEPTKPASQTPQPQTHVQDPTTKPHTPVPQTNPAALNVFWFEPSTSTPQSTPTTTTPSASNSPTSLLTSSASPTPISKASLTSTLQPPPASSVFWFKQPNTAQSQSPSDPKPPHDQTDGDLLENNFVPKQSLVTTPKSDVWIPPVDEQQSPTPVVELHLQHSHSEQGRTLDTSDRPRKATTGYSPTNRGRATSELPPTDKEGNQPVSRRTNRPVRGKKGIPDIPERQLTLDEHKLFQRSQTTFKMFSIDDYLEPNFTGYMKKKTKKGTVLGGNKWVQYWYTIQESRLLEFAQEPEHGAFDLHPDNIISFKYALDINPIGDDRFSVTLPEETLEFRVDPAQREIWIKRLQNVCDVYQSLAIHTDTESQLFSVENEDLAGDMQVKVHGSWKSKYLVLVDGMLIVFRRKGSVRSTKYPLYGAKLKGIQITNEKRWGYMIETEGKKEVSISCFDEIEMQNWLNATLKQKLMIEEVINQIVY